jgi:polyisoprenoid-binding protein YceI
MGHRLTIAMNSWQISVSWADGEPAAADLTVDVESLEVLRGEGGVTPLSPPEKALARSNALKTLGVQSFPRITFRADNVAQTADGYRLTGSLEIHGKARSCVMDVGTEDLGAAWRLSSETVVRQSDFGVKPYSMLMGAMKVADDVTVSFTATVGKDGHPVVT